MTNKKATEDKLGDLHGLLAEVLAKKLRSGEVTAAELGQARQFLRDNNIQADMANGQLRDLAQNVLKFPIMDEEEKERFA